MMKGIAPPRSRADRTNLEILDRGECLALLATQRLGRLAVMNEPGVGPHVVPVNYAMVRGSIVVRSVPGTTLDRLDSEPVTFEVDSFDPFLRLGWSVVVEGLACEVTDWVELEGINLHPLLERPNSRWVRLTPRSINGRRVSTG